MTADSQLDDLLGVWEAQGPWRLTVDEARLLVDAVNDLRRRLDFHASALRAVDAVAAERDDLRRQLDAAAAGPADTPEGGPADLEDLLAEADIRAGDGKGLFTGRYVSKMSDPELVRRLAAAVRAPAPAGPSPAQQAITAEQVRRWLGDNRNVVAVTLDQIADVLAAVAVLAGETDEPGEGQP